MNITNVLMVIAVVAVVVSAGNLAFTLNKSATTGFAQQEQGNVSLEIFQLLSINFTNNLINWSTGNVNSSTGAPPWAYLNTSGVNINNIGFNTVTKGLVLESLSTLNISVNISSNRNATDFLDGGSPKSPPSQFLWQANQICTDDPSGCPNGDGEPGTCAGTLQPTTWANVTTTQTTLCNNMGFIDIADEIELDLAVNISVNAPPGAKIATITATAGPAF